jgi:hypothetical protein
MVMPQQAANLATTIKKGTIEARWVERCIRRDQFSEIQRINPGLDVLLHWGDDG